LSGGDEVLSELLALHPELERQSLRQLVRQAKKDSQNPEARSSRELTRLLRELEKRRAL
jgi:ribosome-associated protein